MSYACILVDPPWNETGGGKIKRGADRHYPLLKTAEIPRVIYQSGMWNPAPHAHLWCWATSNHLHDALWLIQAMGFNYKTHAVRVKQGRPGLGQYLRGQHELLLFAVRGKGYAARTSSRSLSSLISAPRGGHSEKPDAAYTLIEARSHGPRLELFARSQREGWVCWGDELTP